MSELDVPEGGWKLIVVNNASTDDTEARIRKWQNRLPLQYLVEPPALVVDRSADRHVGARYVIQRRSRHRLEFAFGKAGTGAIQHAIAPFGNIVGRRKGAEFRNDRAAENRALRKGIGDAAPFGQPVPVGQDIV
ncbi:MAG: hypothetical protein ACXWLX_03025, partial [Rhizomicrobium sp.]